MAEATANPLIFQIHKNNISVDYEEMTSSSYGKTQKVGFGDNGGSGVRVFKCAWADRAQLARELLGYVLSEPDNRVHIFRPATMPGWSKLVCSTIEVEPFVQPDPANDTVTTASFLEAIIVASYAYMTRATPEDQPNITYVSESLNPSAEFITLPNDSLFWDAANTESLGTADAPGYLVRMMEWQYTLHKVFIMPSAYFTIAGNINSGPVFSRSLGYIFPTGTLLADAPSLSRLWTSEGLPLWDVTFRFLYRPQAQWNLFPRPNVAGASGIIWSPVYNSSGNQLIFYPPTFYGAVVL